MEALPTISNINEVIRRIQKAQQLRDGPTPSKTTFPYIQSYAARPTTSVYSRSGPYHEHTATYEASPKKPRLNEPTASGELAAYRYSTPSGRVVKADFMQVSPANFHKKQLELKRLSLPMNRRGKGRARVGKLVIKIVQPKQKSTVGANVSSTSFFPDDMRSFHVFS